MPIYPTLTSEECRFILDDSGARLLFVSSDALHAKIAGIRGDLPALENVYLYQRSTELADASVWTALRNDGARRLLADRTFAREIDALAAVFFND